MEDVSISLSARDVSDEEPRVTVNVVEHEIRNLEGFLHIGLQFRPRKA